MKRYDPFAFEDDGIPLADMIEGENGKYVEYEDVRQKLEMFDEFLEIMYDGDQTAKTLSRLDFLSRRARALQEVLK